MKTLRLITAALVFTLVAALSNNTQACEITFQIEKGSKTKYAVNDEIVVNVKVVLIHRNCTVNIKNTKFQLDGLKVVGQKDWVETSPGTWERKLKIQVLGNATGKPKLTVTRTCDREGGKGELVLESVVVK